jgi:hypothetical protein
MENLICKACGQSVHIDQAVYDQEDRPFHWICLEESGYDCHKIIFKPRSICYDCGAIFQKALIVEVVGEEALSIAVYCSLKHRDDFRKAVIASVNHSGDSDSTGAITGNIVGAFMGLRSIPEEWIDILELKEAISKVADDLLVYCQES